MNYQLPLHKFAVVDDDGGSSGMTSGHWGLIYRFSRYKPL